MDEPTRKRADARADTRQALWCEGQALGAGETRNVSRSGMFIVADRTPVVGEHLTISFSDELGGDVEVDTEVVWTGPSSTSDRPGVGVRVLDFKKGQQAYERFVSRHLAEEDALARKAG